MNYPILAKQGGVVHAQMYADERCGDRVIQIRNKNLQRYIDRNWDLRGELRILDGTWRKL